MSDNIYIFVCELNPTAVASHLISPLNIHMHLLMGCDALQPGTSFSDVSEEPTSYIFIVPPFLPRH
jgi:hypothetical protein